MVGAILLSSLYPLILTFSGKCIIVPTMKMISGIHWMPHITIGSQSFRLRIRGYFIKHIDHPQTQILSSVQW